MQNSCHSIYPLSLIKWFSLGFVLEELACAMHVHLLTRHLYILYIHRATSLTAHVSNPPQLNFSSFRL